MVASSVLKLTVHMENPFVVDLTKIDKISGSDNPSQLQLIDKSQAISTLTRDYLNISVPELTKLSSIFSHQQDASPHGQLADDIFLLKKEMIQIIDQVNQKDKLFNKKQEKFLKLETKLKKNLRNLKKIKKIAENHQKILEIIENKLNFSPNSLNKRKLEETQVITSLSDQKLVLPNLKIKPRKDKTEASPVGASSLKSQGEKSPGLIHSKKFLNP